MVASLCCQFGARVWVFLGICNMFFSCPTFWYFGQILFKIGLKRIGIPGQKIEGFGFPFWGPDLVPKLGHKYKIH